MLSLVLAMAGTSAIVNVLFAFLFACLACYAIRLMAPTPLKNIGYIVVAALFLLYVWRSGIVS